MFPWSYDAAFLAAFISNIFRKKDSAAAKVGDYMPADSPEIDDANVDPLEETWDNLRKLAEHANGERIDPNSQSGRGDGEV